MTGLDAKQRIRTHEVRRHRDQRAIGEQEVALVPELFDAGKNVIPAAAIQPGGMLAQFVKNFVHLERGRNRLDEHRRANRSLRNAELVLRQLEGVIPNARLEMALHFRQIKIRTASARDQLFRVVKKEEPEVEQPAGDRFTINQEMLFKQMPPAWPNEKHCAFFVQLVPLALRTREANRAADRVPQIDLAFNHIPPCRRVRVLEIRHKNLRTGVERVNNHLAIGRSRDFDTPILDVGRNGRAFPVAFADLFRFRQEIEGLPMIERVLPLAAP